MKVLIIIVDVYVLFLVMFEIGFVYIHEVLMINMFLGLFDCVWATFDGRMLLIQVMKSQIMKSLRMRGRRDLDSLKRKQSMPRRSSGIH